MNRQKIYEKIHWTPLIAYHFILRENTPKFITATNDWKNLKKEVLENKATFHYMFYILSTNYILYFQKLGKGTYIIYFNWFCLCFRDLWLLNKFLDFNACPQRSQGIEMPVMWWASMWFFIFVQVPSFPHTLHILALPSFFL